LSTFYKTREVAFQKGFEYADRKDLAKLSLEEMIKHPEIRIDEDTEITGILGNKLTGQTTLEFLNGRNMKVKMASCNFQMGFDLWLIMPNGTAVRS